MLVVYIWTEESYSKKETTLPLCSWQHPLIPTPGDTLTVDGNPRIVGKVRRIFESIGEDLIINVIVWFRGNTI